MGPHRRGIASEGGTRGRACAVGEVSQPEGRREPRVGDAPVDGASAQTAVGATQAGGEYDQRLEIDGLPVVAPRGAIDPKLGPQAPGKVKGERINFLVEAAHLRAGTPSILASPPNPMAEFANR